MSRQEPTAESESYGFGFDIRSPGGIKLVRMVLNHIEDNESISRISLDVEADEPLNIQDVLATGSSSTSEGQSESHSSTSTSTDQPTANGSSPSSSSGSEASASVSSGDAPEAEDEDRYSLSIETVPYKVSSAMLYLDERYTASDLEAILDETEWGLSRQNISSTLSRLAKEGVFERETRQQSGPGKNPYEYWVTDLGKEIIADAEERAEFYSVPTFGDLPSIAEETEGFDDETNDTAGETTEADAAETEDTDGRGSESDIAEADTNLDEAETTTTSEPGADDTESDSTELSESKTEQLDAGEVPEDAKEDLEEQQAGSEPYEPEEVGTASDAVEDAAELDILTRERAYHIASALTLTNAPVVPRELEELLEGTGWEHSRSNISGDLGELFSAALVDRDPRDAPGQPYEYSLTEDGRDRVNALILAADEAGEETINDVMRKRIHGDAEFDNDEMPIASEDIGGDEESGVEALYSEDDDDEGGFELYTGDDE